MFLVKKYHVVSYLTILSPCVSGGKSTVMALRRRRAYGG
jgi:hypothetical protein